MIIGLQPSYWQQVVAGLVVIVPTLLIGAMLLGWFTRSVLQPRAAGRRWPEGARGIRLIVETIVDLQRHGARQHGDERSRLQPIRFGLVIAACAVVPVSTGLVLTQPGLGLYVLAVALGLDAAVQHFGDPAARSGSGNGHTDLAWLTRIGLAGVLAVGAGVVHAQWGTGSLPAIVTAQADAAVGGNAIWGLSTMFVQPIGALVAVLAVYATVVSMATSTAATDGGPPGLFAQLVNQAWVIAMAAWLVAVFAGGGAVPWAIDNPGTRQVTSVAVFATKTLVVTIALAWARVTWPTVTVRSIRALLGVGAVVGVVSIGLTLLVRHFV